MSEIEELKKILKDHEKRLAKLELSLKPKSTTSPKPAKERITIIDMLIELKNEDFFKEPKTWQQIADKLSERGYTYPRTSLTAPLQRSVKRHILGRIKQVDDQWGYVAR